MILGAMCPMVLGNHPSSTTVEPPVPTFIAASTLVETSAGVWTGAAANLGTADANRRVFVVLCANSSSGRTVASATINGVAATIHADVNRASVEWLSIISAVVPDDASGDIVVTMSADLFSGGLYAVYTVDNTTLNSAIPGATGEGEQLLGTTTSLSVDTLADGFVLGATQWANGASKSSITVTGFTIDSSSSARVFFSKSGTAAGTETPVTEWVGDFSADSLAGAWR